MLMLPPPPQVAWQDLARRALACVLLLTRGLSVEGRRLHGRNEGMPTSNDLAGRQPKPRVSNTSVSWLQGYCPGNYWTDTPVKSRDAFCQSTFQTWYLDGGGQPWHNRQPTMHECVERCAACAECRYASYARGLKDCSLYAACDTQMLSHMPDEYRTVEVTPTPIATSCQLVATKMPTCKLCLASPTHSRATDSDTFDCSRLPPQDLGRRYVGGQPSIEHASSVACCRDRPWEW